MAQTQESALPSSDRGLVATHAGGSSVVSTEGRTQREEVLDKFHQRKATPGMTLKEIFSCFDAANDTQPWVFEREQTPLRETNSQ